MPKHLRHRSIALLALALLSAPACRSRDFNLNAQETMIGGNEVAQNDARFTPTLLFVVRGHGKVCTGVKVSAAQILTAAHCVFSRKDKRHFLNPGDVLWFTTDRNFSQLNVDMTKEWVVERVQAHDDFKQENPQSFNDIALITLANKIDWIPRAKLKFDAIPAGTSVIKTGYGCEEAKEPDNWWNRITGIFERRIPNRLKWAPDTIIGVDHYRTIFRRFGLNPDTFDAATAQRQFLFTEGILAGNDNSLCNGDSGGPLFLNDTEGLTVVGINATGFFPEEHRESYWDMHTRLSTFQGWISERLIP